MLNIQVGRIAFLHIMTMFCIENLSVEASIGFARQKLAIRVSGNPYDD
jgi:hypothetical protein